MQKIAVLMVTLLLIFASRSEATKYAGEFLSLGVGARALGMGSAYVALADDATAGYWNPAGLARLAQRELVLMHAEQFGEIANYDYGAYAQPFGDNGSLSINLIRLSIDDIAVVPPDAFVDHDGDGVLDPGEFNVEKISFDSDAQNALLLSYGRYINDRLRLGGSVKIIYKNTLDYHAWGLGLDVGAMYDVTNGFTVGMVLTDATSSPLIWNTDDSTTETISPSLRFGVAYTMPISFMFGTVTTTGDMNLQFEGREAASNFASGAVSGNSYWGIEYLFQDHLAFRIGSQEENMTAGAGLRITPFWLDYAFVGHDDLDDTHRISATVQF